ncbi:hypothetical protein AFL94_08910 [Arthrobacter sp. LS16]|nr:hypothetical protein AFL94_08910 [Arthrobacter sp. LS16]
MDLSFSVSGAKISYTNKEICECFRLFRSARLLTLLEELLFQQNALQFKSYCSVFALRFQGNRSQMRLVLVGSPNDENRH